MQPIDLTREIARGIGWTDADLSEVAIRDTGEPLATVWPIGRIAAGALAATGAAANEIARARGCGGAVTVDTRAAALAMCANDYLRVDGADVVKWPALTGFYRARDAWVFLHGGFRPQARRLVRVLDAPEDRDGVARRVATMQADEIETRALAANVCARRVRSADEWRSHPAAQAIAERPLLSCVASSVGDPRPLTPAPKPLSGIRVLDLSRVLAGPTIGRTLAEHGASVLRISSPHLPFSEPLSIDTGYGKRAAHVDLATSDGRRILAGLVSQADIVIDGYRPGALSARGFGPDDMERLAPGLIHVSLSAFGRTGPWGGQRGYDSLVQATAGLWTGNPPRRMPCQPLDYLAGYLGAFAAMRAVALRAMTGCGARVELSLAGMAGLLLSLRDRMPDVVEPAARNPTPEEISGEITSLDTVFGHVTSLRPALQVPWQERNWSQPSRLGADAAQWQASQASCNA